MKLQEVQKLLAQATAEAEANHQQTVGARVIQPSTI